MNSRPHGPDKTVRMNSRLRGTLLLPLTVLGAVILATLPLRLSGQNVDLPSQSDPNLRALLAERDALQLIWKNGIALYDIPAPPDADTLRELAKTANSAASDLRAITDLLMVYNSMRSTPDRATVKPLLEDRLRLYSSQLNGDADRIAGLLKGTPSVLPATRKKILEVQTGLLAAESKLTATAASLR